MLYRKVELVDGETEVQFLAVHAVKWQPEWGAPRCGFLEVDVAPTYSAAELEALDPDELIHRFLVYQQVRGDQLQSVMDRLAAAQAREQVLLEAITNIVDGTWGLDQIDEELPAALDDAGHMPGASDTAALDAHVERAVAELREELAAAEALMQEFAAMPQRAQAVMEEHGFVMDDLDDPWQKFAFTLYNYLVEIASKVEHDDGAALDAALAEGAEALDLAVDMVHAAWRERLALAREWIERAQGRIYPQLAAQNTRARQAWDCLNDALENLDLATGETDAGAPGQ